MALAAGHLSLSALAVKDVQQFRAKRRSFYLVRAASSGPEDDSSNSLKLKKAEEEEEDARYVLKLGIGSVCGAAVIKYGSVLVPQVTTPNLPEALLIIVTPVVAASLILLLISTSKTEETSP